MRRHVGGHDGWSWDVVHGSDAVSGCADEVEGLARRVGDGVVACAWAFPTLVAACARAWAVLVRDRCHQLVAAAVFVDLPERDRVVATLAGSEGGSRVSLLSVSRPAGELLCSAVAEEVRSRNVALDLGPLSAADPSLQDLVRLVPDCELVPVDSIPLLRRGPERDLEPYLSHGTRRTLRKARNRMAADGMTCRIDFLRDVARVESLLPVMEQLYRDRDHEGARPSLVDTALGKEIWRRRILGLLAKDHGEVATLHLGDALAAYVLGVWDGGWYGIPEGRFRTNSARYAPGRVLEAAVIHRVLGETELRGVDWLSAVAPESLIAVNDADPTVRLMSSALVRAGQTPLSVPHPRLEHVGGRSVGATP